MNPTPGPRSRAARTVFLVAAGLAVLAFLALGTWQVQRRAWKLDLIARVEQRVHAAPADMPGPAAWPDISAARDEYRRVRATGTFLHDRETLVVASTERGPGYWVMTPLRLADGTMVLVNRGFVPPERRDRSTRPEENPGGEVALAGLLRMTEPGGSLLRHNDPAAGRWYSRDVQAIAAARGLGPVAPYFIDAEAGPAGSAAPGAPVGGLTVVAFRNNHLEYALTWYALALVGAIGIVALLRSERAHNPPVSR